ncbi:hypothetical protein PBRA_001579 [Plasmodiophora brassicae]|uniref:Uncharacterized protein n=1 Tax=Plasmodiophora brassicae TaxID=37360 RepID=A0A0G4IYW9_PLABS|nr:hypothetical protein PBRA_001579 [Plasmodiophora brassicae]
MVRPAKELRVANRVPRVRPEQVGAKALGRFVRHLDAPLEDGDREPVARVRRQPQAVVGVRAGRRRRLDDALQRWHPRDRQVAVLQDHPGATCLRHFNHGCRQRALVYTSVPKPGWAFLSRQYLALPQRYRLETRAEPVVGCELQQARVRVLTGEPQFWWGASTPFVSQRTDPGDRMNMRGIVGSESRNAAPRSNGGASTNRCPRRSPTKSRTAGNTLSGRRQRSINIFWNESSAVPTSTCVWCGSNASYTRFQSALYSPNVVARLANAGNDDDRRHRSDQTESCSQSGQGLLDAGPSESTAMPPVRHAAQLTQR